MTTMTTQKREYDIVLLGATGFTGGFIADTIISKFPTATRWIVAGRNHSKLVSLRDRLGQQSPQGPLPEIQMIDVSKDNLNDLAAGTRILLNAIGPYTTYGEPVLKACASNGTTYLDFSTETPWIEEMIRKYHDKAKESHAKILPAIGNSSSPSALVAYLLAKQFLKTHDGAVQKMLCSYDMKIKGMSSGSLSSVTTVVSRYGIRPLLFPDSYRLCLTTVRRPLHNNKPLLGHIKDPVLGHLATSFVATGNEAVVYRSQKLQRSIYKADFTYQEFMPATSSTQAIVIHLATKFAIILLSLWPFRTLINRLKPESGTGPSRELTKGEKIHLKAIARDENGKELKAEYLYNGPMYYHTAILGTTAAVVLLDMWKVNDGEIHSELVEGEDEQFGILTPSYLGMPFIEKLRKVGVEIEVVD